MNRSPLTPALLRQVFMLGVILVFGFIIILQLMPYLSGFLGALTLFILFKGWMRKLLLKGVKPPLAAGLLIFGSLFMVIIPLWLLAKMSVSKMTAAAESTREVIAMVRNKSEELDRLLGYDILSGLNAEAVTQWITANVQELIGSTLDIIIILSIMYFLLYYMLVRVNDLRKFFEQYIPVSQTNMDLITRESNQIVRSNAIGIPLVAVLQGLVALAGYYIFGVPAPVFWFVITMIGSMIPLIGTAVGIIPVSLLLYAGGETFQAIGILIYGMLIVGATDNIFRMIVQNQMANLHPLITLIGVIIGLPLFGFMGLIFGPLLLSLFLLLIKIYRNEYGAKSDPPADTPH